MGNWDKYSKVRQEGPITVYRVPAYHPRRVLTPRLHVAPLGRSILIQAPLSSLGPRRDLSRRRSTSMTSSPPDSFAAPAMSGDAVSVLVLAEDSPAMASKWPDVRDEYLPNLLVKLRAVDPTVQVRPSPPLRFPLLILLSPIQMEARWLTTSSASPIPPQSIPDTARARNVPELPLGRVSNSKHSPESITHAIRVRARTCTLSLSSSLTHFQLHQVLSSTSQRQSTTRHLVLVAATGPLTQGTHTDATPSGFDPWDEIALVLKQVILRHAQLCSSPH